MMYFNCMAGHLLSMGLIGSFLSRAAQTSHCRYSPAKTSAFFLPVVKILSFYFLVRQLKEFLSDEFLLVSVQTITEKSRLQCCVFF